MTANLTGVDGRDIIRRSIEESGGSLDVLQVSPGVLGDYIEVASEERDKIERMRVLVHEESLKEVMRDFLISSAASDLIKEGVLEILSTDDTVERSVAILDDTETISFIETDDSIGTVAAENDELAESVSDLFDSMWEDGDEFKIRTPPMSDVSQSLRDEIGDETEDDFRRVLDLLDAAKGDGEGLDEITVALLVAAKNKILLYDISKWGEDSGVASKATFSRKKTELEDAGLIDTEKEPIDIGRPRLRLRLGDEDLQDADIDGIVAEAKQKLS